MSGEPYNPLAKLNLGRSVAEALLQVDPAPLSSTGGLVGAGVYAIYYTGAFPPYAPIADRNRNGAFGQPLYVGKAVPKGARKGGLAFNAGEGLAMRGRLRNHAQSIDQADNLDLADFQFRSLVVDDIWIPLGENMLIEQYKPIWNVVIDGFGNKTPGARRFTQYRSRWDVLHPGRTFASKLADGGTTPADVIKRIEDHFAGRVVAPIPPEDAADAGTDEDDDG